MRRQTFGRRHPPKPIETTKPFPRLYKLGGGAVVLLGLVLLRGVAHKSSVAVDKETPLAVSVGDVCRASIAALMGRNVDIIRTDSQKGDVAFVGYTRPSDGSVWKQRCRVGDSTVVWAAADGRWRDNAEWDEIITYTVTRDDIAIFIGYPGRPADQAIKRFPLTDLVRVDGEAE